MKKTRIWSYSFVGVLSCALYLNALHCGFVFDDISAVRDNRDLRPHTPVLNLFYNDFWGTPIQKEHSHKSYRPLCVLTFRLNYYLDGLNPVGYHLVNVILHSIVCCLYLRLCLMFLPQVPSLLASVLFSIHPVHTEAVTGVVGRAEPLSSIFFILAFFAYVKYSNQRKTVADLGILLHCIPLVVIATLCKEQGITVIGVCCMYEVFILQKLRVQDMYYLMRTNPFLNGSFPLWLRRMLVRLSIIIIAAVALLFLRFKIMGAQLPVFTRFDNPAAVAGPPTRQLTFNYLLAVNSWLLLFPCNLCCDWTMGTVPLVESIWDGRNVATLMVYAMVLALLWSSFSSEDSHSSVLIMALSLMILPFLPASNLFFPVGFVIAERVLYMPSMGFCLLVAYGCHLLYQKAIWKHWIVVSIVILILSHVAKTWMRNYDWETEQNIFKAGLKVNQRNAKLYNNVGHALESQGKFEEALEYFLSAVRIQPDDLGAHMNVGRTYNNLQMYSKAEDAFRKAKDLLPRSKPGGKYQARIAPSHLNVFLNLANLIARNTSRLEEADALYRQAISMRADYTQAYINRGDILLKLNRTQEAQEVYEQALHIDNKNPDIYYNLGVVFIEQGKGMQALVYFNKALELDPEHEQALMNSAILIQESGKSDMREIAFERLRKLLHKGQENERIYFNLGMLAMDDNDLGGAEAHFRKAIQLRPDFRSALFNLALLLSDSNRPLDAVPILKQLLEHHPHHIKGLILLGDIYINHVKDLNLAEKCYNQILQLDPTNIQGLHNLCVVHVERGNLSEAEKCLQKAVSLAPNEAYIQRHLRIVQSRLQKLDQEKGQGPTAMRASSLSPTVGSTDISSSHDSGQGHPAAGATESRPLPASTVSEVYPSATAVRGDSRTSS